MAPRSGDRKPVRVGPRMHRQGAWQVQGPENRRLKGRVNGVSVVAPRFVRHGAVLQQDLPRARRRQRDSKASRRTLRCPSRGHIPTVSGRRAPWVSVPGCRTRRTGPLVMSSYQCRRGSARGRLCVDPDQLVSARRLSGSPGGGTTTSPRAWPPLPDRRRHRPRP